MRERVAWEGRFDDCLDGRVLTSCGPLDEIRTQLTVKFTVLFPHLHERQRRLLMAAEARVLGHGGVRVVARAASV
ncbi:hypothetical protein ABZZ74_46700 [Streptomyces sp. NPDC006476]|uniref:hypothetical protein n=1 Tax=Streptomyces sp. NPDC006476 TaxID=3157175 RepID=UPI0033AC089A